MRKNKTKLFCLATLAVTLTVAGAAFGMGMFRTSAAEWQGSFPEDEWKTGMQLVIPEKTLTDGDATVKAQSVLIFPDGNATASTQVTLPMSGIYKVVYTAELDGKIYKTEEEFTVYDGLYSVSSSTSSVTYGKHPLAGTTEGLIVRLAEGDTLTFNTIIDVSQATSSSSIIDLFVTPDSPGTMDFSRITVVLTDVEDPSCTLTFSGKQSSDGVYYPYTYFLAGGDGQPRTGLEASGILHVDNQWGRSVSHSFYGVYPTGGVGSELVVKDQSDYALSLRYDAATVSAYANGQFIIDMDDPEYFTNLWTGFTSSRVRVSVYAEEYESDSANFVIRSVMGMDLTETEIVDRNEPEIEIATEYDSAPDAKVGLAYPIPLAAAKDDYSGDCKVKTSVWYNYGASNAVLVNVSDGEFIPTREGTYAIVYEASDHAGNLASEVILVMARKEVDPIVLELPSDPQTEGSAGAWVEVKEAAFSGGSGNLTVTVMAKFGDRTTEITEGGFYPEESGVYEIIYTAIDYIGQETTDSYEVTVGKGGEPVFREEPELPRVFVSGSQYTLPTFYAYDYSSGKLEMKEASLSITDAEGTREVNGSFVPVVENNFDEVTLSYTAGETKKDYNVPCVVPFVEEDGIPRLRIDNYMIKDGVSVERGNTSMRITAEKSDASWSFARELLAENFEAELLAASESKDFGALRVTLTDIDDPSVSVSVGLINNPDRLRLEINGGIIELATNFAEMGTVRLGYLNGYFSVGTTRIALKTEFGEAFEGFPSGQLYFEIAFENAKAGAAYEFASLNGQPFTNVSTDRITPKIVVLGDTGGAKSIGTTVTIPAASAADVLDPVVAFSLSVIAPDGNPVTDTDGLKLENVDPTKEYTFLLEEYGQYYIMYVAADEFNGKDEEYNYVINVEDEVPPEFVLNGEIQETAKVGDMILIPSYTVTDNLDPTEEITVLRYLYTPDGTLIQIPVNSNAIRFQYEGKYEIRFMLVDVSGNVRLVKYGVTVSAA